MPTASKALLALALGVGLTAASLARWTPGSPWAPAAVAGGLAALLGALLRLPRWWWALLALFPVTAAAALRLEVPAWGWAAAAGALALTYGGVHRSQVPLFLSRRAVWDAVVALLPPPAPAMATAPGRRPRFIDLGSAFGGLPRHVAASCTDIDAHGVEAAPLPALLAAVRQRLWPQSHVTLRRGDLWTTPLGDADLVFAFLSPVPMPALWRKVAGEMRAGALFVSCEFPVPGVRPARVVEGAHRTLYVYLAPGQA